MIIEESNLFSKRSALPAQIEVPTISARVLIDGKILTQGFAAKGVLSPCSLRDEKTDQLFFPEMGQTSDVDAPLFAQAVDVAVRAWSSGRGEWPSARLAQRAAAVEAFRDRMQKSREMICRLIMWEIAKNWSDAQAEFDRTIQYITDTVVATRALDQDSDQLKQISGVLAQIRRTPLGVTLCMGPFNYPLNETFTTLIPALIMGNPVVVKLPRFGQLFWDFLLEPFRDSFPPGVVNVLNGDGKRLIPSAIKTGKIDLLAFIGSSVVANQLKLAHPRPHHFRSILGLDAKNPAIILPDAELETAAAECVKGALSFNGQRCTALKIIFVQRSIAENFIELFTKKVESLVCGLPWEKGVSITPLPDPQKCSQLKGYMDAAIQAGAKLCNPKWGGRAMESLFFPTVLRDVPLISALANEEQFGPLVPIVTYDSVREFEDYMARSPYGLQASIFGSDPVVLGELIDALANQVCRININSQCQRGPDQLPFTGRKNSAEGTLSVTDALRSFSIRTMVATQNDSRGQEIIQRVINNNYSQFLK